MGQNIQQKTGNTAVTGSTRCCRNLLGHPRNNPQPFFDHRRHRCAVVFTKLPADAVRHNSADGKTFMPQYAAHPVNTGCFHFEVGDVVVFVREAGQVVDEMGVRQCAAQHAALDRKGVG